MYVAGDPDRAPVWVSFPQACLHAGAEAAAASLIAHYYRELTGEGQHVDVSVQECVMEVLMWTQEAWDLLKFNWERTGVKLMNPVTGAGTRMSLPCKDGHISIFLTGDPGPSTPSMQAIVKWMDEEGVAPEWLKEIDFYCDYDATKLTQDFIDHVEAAIGDFFMTKTKAELYEAAFQRRLILAPVNTAEDIWRNEQLKSRDFWVEVEHPELGDILTCCGSFVKSAEVPPVIKRRAPLISEHNDDIYKNELGLSKGELTLLKKSWDYLT